MELTMYAQGTIVVIKLSIFPDRKAEMIKRQKHKAIIKLTKCNFIYIKSQDHNHADNSKSIIMQDKISFDVHHTLNSGIRKSPKEIAFSIIEFPNSSDNPGLDNPVIEFSIPL